MENQVQIEKLIEKFHLGTLSNEELAFLLNYLKDQEPQHEVSVFYQHIWDRESEFNPDIDSKNIYDQVISNIGITGAGLIPATESPKGVKSGGYVIRIMQYAAVFIVAFLISWQVHSYFGDETVTPPIVNQVHNMEVPYGSKSRIVLPDGSVVDLNSGSGLKYSSSDFNSDSRSVSLTGEGFFSITKDSARPFYVTTAGIKLKVLGTTFNVKAYPDENMEEATLISGKVEIYASSDKTENGKPIVLKPNQRAVFLKSQNYFLTNDSLVTNPLTSPVKLKTINIQSPSNIEQTISWKENKLIFDNESFSSLIIKIERWYNVKIIVNYAAMEFSQVYRKV